MTNIVRLYIVYSMSFVTLIVFIIQLTGIRIALVLCITGCKALKGIL